MQRTILRHMLFLTVLGMPIWGSGCGGAADSDRPTTYPVTGTLTVKGQPLAGANVNFQLVDGSRSAVGVTDSQGRYELTTFTAGDGALPGEYLVAVTKYETPPPNTGVPDDHPDYDPHEPEFVAKNLLPAKYASPQTSGLTATVAEDRRPIDFDLID